MSLTSLFDHIERSNYDTARYLEPEFRYLNHSARAEMKKARILLDDWFTRFPTDGQHQLREQFRSENNHQMQSAFFELFLNELLLRLGYQVDSNCQVAG